MGGDQSKLKEIEKDLVETKMELVETKRALEKVELKFGTVSSLISFHKQKVRDSPWSKWSPAHPAKQKKQGWFERFFVPEEQGGGRIERWVNQHGIERDGLVSFDGQVLTVQKTQAIQPNSTPFRVVEQNGWITGISYWGYRYGYSGATSGPCADLQHDVRFHELFASK
jgi:hypothetical protein